MVGNYLGALRFEIVFYYVEVRVVDVVDFYVHVELVGVRFGYGVFV